MALSAIWLLTGAALLALEAFGFPGVGFLFAGLGAILVGLLVELGLIATEALVAQWAVFFLATALSAILLWQKLKRWRLNPESPQYSNIVGTEAMVTQTLIADLEGQVKWSGTLMRARLAPGTVAELLAGAPVIVRQVDGNVLIVAPK